MNGAAHQIDPDLCRYPDLGIEASAYIFNESKQQLGLDKDVLSVEGPIFCHLHDTQRLVGEMCIQNNRYWPTSELWWDSRLLNGYVTMSGYLSSEGITRRPRMRLNGMSAEDYERRESEV